MTSFTISAWCGGQDELLGDQRVVYIVGHHLHDGEGRGWARAAGGGGRGGPQHGLHARHGPGVLCRVLYLYRVLCWVLYKVLCQYRVLAGVLYGPGLAGGQLVQVG